MIDMMSKWAGPSTAGPEGLAPKSASSPILRPPDLRILAMARSRASAESCNSYTSIANESGGLNKDHLISSSRRSLLLSRSHSVNLWGQFGLGALPCLAVNPCPHLCRLRTSPPGNAIVKRHRSIPTTRERNTSAHL